MSLGFAVPARAQELIHGAQGTYLLRDRRRDELV
jgi:hypothetical protein